MKKGTGFIKKKVETLERGKTKIGWGSLLQGGQWGSGMVVLTQPEEYPAIGKRVKKSGIFLVSSFAGLTKKKIQKGSLTFDGDEKKEGSLGGVFFC